MKFQPTIFTLVLAFGLGFLAGGGGLPDLVDVLPGPAPAPTPEVKATAATYVYEKDEHAVPNYVLSAFNRLNRERGIVATLLEADPQDGTGDVPDQYRVPLTAAREAGLPALVVTAGNEVLAVVTDPEDEQAVLDSINP